MSSYIYTPWGYEVASLPALLSVSDFHTITCNRHTDKSVAQIDSAIDAASAAIRNVCGWHVAPSLECRATITAGDELTGERTRIVALPASYVSGIYSVTEDGEELPSGQFAAMKNGLLRRTCFKSWSNRWGGVEVDYQAGFDLTTVPDLSNAAAHVIEAALSIPIGVSSETAGSVSVSYDTQVSAVAAMTAAQLSGALSAYKVVRSHAA